MTEFTATFKTYTLSTDTDRLNITFIHSFLSASHWSQGIPRETVEKSIANSLCFGVYTESGEQVGFARIISDYTTFAYFCDVFVLEEHRGFGLSRWLVEQILTHPDLQGLRKFALYTSRAQDIYSRYGFQPVTDPQNWMEIHHKDLYIHGAEREAP